MMKGIRAVAAGAAFVVSQPLTALAAQPELDLLLHKAQANGCLIKDSLSLNVILDQVDKCIASSNLSAVQLESLRSIRNSFENLKVSAHNPKSLDIEKVLIQFQSQIDQLKSDIAQLSAAKNQMRTPHHRKKPQNLSRLSQYPVLPIS